MIMY